MGQRRMGSAQRTRKRAKVKSRNTVRKTRERASRDARMVETIRGGSLPYAPWVMSWLSEKLDKRSRTITQAEVDQVAASAAPTA